MAGVLLAEIWQWTPFMFVILLAGLTAIPPNLYEAAELDGVVDVDAVSVVDVDDVSDEVKPGSPDTLMRISRAIWIRKPLNESSMPTTPRKTRATCARSGDWRASTFLLLWPGWPATSSPGPGRATSSRSIPSRVR